MTVFTALQVLTMFEKADAEYAELSQKKQILHMDKDKIEKVPVALMLTAVHAAMYLSLITMPANKACVGAHRRLCSSSVQPHIVSELYMHSANMASNVSAKLLCTAGVLVNISREKLASVGGCNTVCRLCSAFVGHLQFEQ